MSTPTGYRVGDPDPTIELPDSVACPAESGYRYPFGFYLCTWPKGHDGLHVAGDSETILAVWP